MDHGAAEQFHSEFKTTLDIERLPSGKFDTNDLVVGMAAFAYNLLRSIGLIGLLGEIYPVRHPAKRRRLKTVIQELMYLVAQLIATKWRLTSCASAATVRPSTTSTTSWNPAEGTSHDTEKCVGLLANTIALKLFLWCRLLLY